MLSGGGSLTKVGSGTLILSGINTYTGVTQINQGTLQLGAADRLANNSNLVLNGGTFATAGFNETVGTLTVSANSTLDLGAAAGSTSIKFADSHSLTANWSGTLNITGWTYKTDQLSFGVDSNGLTNAQLDEIHFADFHIGASIAAATGEVTPCIGDINQDGAVSPADVSSLMFALANQVIPGTGQTYQNHFFAGASDPVDDVAFILDVNRDGFVNNQDIQAEIALIANGGSPGGASFTAVPEPSGIVLITLGGLIFRGQRFRKVQKRRIHRE